MWLIHILILIHFSYQFNSQDVPLADYEDNETNLGLNVTIKPYEQEVFSIPVKTWPGKGETLRIVTEYVSGFNRSVMGREGKVSFTVLYDHQGNQWDLTIYKGGKHRADQARPVSGWSQPSLLLLLLLSINLMSY